MAYPWTTATDTNRGSRSQVKPRWNCSIAADASSSDMREQPRDRLDAVAGRRRVEHRPVEPGRERLPAPPDHDDAHVVGDLLADRGERPPHRRGLGVADLGSVQGHDGDLAGHLVDESGAILGSHGSLRGESCARRLMRPAAGFAQARETRSAYDAVQRSSTPSGRISTRSGSRACTAPSSWVTSTMAPS